MVTILKRISHTIDRFVYCCAVDSFANDGIPLRRQLLYPLTSLWLRQWPKSNYNIWGEGHSEVSLILDMYSFIDSLLDKNPTTEWGGRQIQSAIYNTSTPTRGIIIIIFHSIQNQRVSSPFAILCFRFGWAVLGWSVVLNDQPTDPSAIRRRWSGLGELVSPVNNKSIR